MTKKQKQAAEKLKTIRNADELMSAITDELGFCFGRTAGSLYDALSDPDSEEVAEYILNWN
jgi:hypothetical protein